MIRLKDAVITTIALCKRGKNQLTTVYKSADDSLEVRTVVKGNTEAGELLAVVYAPERPDDDGEGMSATEIRKMAHRAMQGGLDIDIEHVDGTKVAKGDAWVAESFIVAKGDERFANWTDYKGNPVGDLTGAWASLIRLESEPLRAAYRRGDFDGVSMFGTAAVEQRKSHAAHDVVRRLEGATTENDMDPKELKEILKAQSEELLTAVDEKITSALAKAAETEEAEETDEDPRPVFKGNVTDSEALIAYKDKLAAWELNQKIAKGEVTADQLAELVKSATEGEPSDDDAGIEKADTPEVRSLKRELFKAQKASNTKSVEKSDEGSDGPLDARAAIELGNEIAKTMNRETEQPGFLTVPKTD